MNVAPGATFEAVADFGVTGLTPGVRILDNAGATTTARTTSGISEYPAGSGIYSKSLTAPSTAGQYTIAWDNGTQTAGNFATEDLIVGASASTISASGGLYVTLATMKNRLSITTTGHDDQLNSAIAAACRNIDRECGRLRKFALDADATTVRYYSPEQPGQISIHDCSVITSVAVDPSGTGAFGTTWTAGTHFNAAPYDAVEDGVPYETLELTGSATMPYYRRSVRVTGQFGWPAIPEDIYEAAQILASRYFKRREATMGVIGFGLDGSTTRISRSDPDVYQLVEPFSRRRTFL